MSQRQAEGASRIFVIHPSSPGRNSRYFYKEAKSQVPAKGSRSEQNGGRTCFPTESKICGRIKKLEKKAAFYNTQGTSLCLEQVLWGWRKPVRPKEGVRKVPLTIYKSQIPHNSRGTADWKSILCSRFWPSYFSKKIPTDPTFLQGTLR